MIPHENTADIVIHLRVPNVILKLIFPVIISVV